MKSTLTIFFMGVWFVALIGCGGRRASAIESKKQLLDYVTEPANGLRQVDSIGEIEAVLTWRPWQLMAVDATGPNGGITQAAQLFKKDLCFVLSLSARHKELLRQTNPRGYSELVQTLSFRMGGFIKAYPDQQAAVEPLECRFLQTYGMGTANNIIVIFDKAKLIGARNINIRVAEFGLGTGNLNFRFDMEDIKKLPLNTLK